MTDRPPMKRAITSDKPMIRMLDERQKQLHRMQDAKMAKQEVEHAIIKEILNKGDTELLSVNWTRLYRQSGWGRT